MTEHRGFWLANAHGDKDTQPSSRHRHTQAPIGDFVTLDIMKLGLKSPIRAFLLIAGAACLVASIGSVYQVERTRMDLAAFPAPGRMVAVNGVNYHLLCLGTGQPTLVLEAGLGENSLSWHPVQSGLARDMRVCSYDRAGLGWSEPVDAPALPDDVAGVLHALLRQAGIPPPYVLIGHSRGGIFVRAFHHRFPDDTLGLVLVDSTHEQGPTHQYRYAKWDYLKQAILVAIAEPLSRTGAVRTLGLANADRRPSPLPRQVLAAKSAIQNRSATAHAIVNEISIMRRGLAPSTPPPRSLGNLPLLVLTAGNRIDLDLVERKAMNANEEVAAERKLARIQRIEQRDLTALSTNSRQIVVKNSGHYIMYDQPDILIGAVRKFVASLPLTPTAGRPTNRAARSARQAEQVLSCCQTNADRFGRQVHVATAGGIRVRQIAMEASGTPVNKLRLSVLSGHLRPDTPDVCRRAI